MSIPTAIKEVPRSTSDAISLVTDPYHDYNLRLSGFPDGKALISAIQRFAGRYDISCPFTLNAGETWDFHVFTTPLHSVTPFFAGISSIGTVLTMLGNATSNDVGPVNVLYKRYSSAGVVNSTILIALPSTVEADSVMRRTVSLGYEIHNTTPELYKSGSVSVYRQPILDSHADIVFNITSAPVSRTINHVQLICQVPYSIADVQMLPNTRTWEASEGVYSVCLPHSNNDFSCPIATTLLIKAGILDNSYLSTRIDASTVIRHSTFSPLHCSGVMSSRFSDSNQTYVLDFRQTIETIPSTDNLTLMSFAGTAPSADLGFLKLYKRMINNIPPGVPVHFNEAGDWWRSIISVVKDVLPAVSAALPGHFKPIAMALTPAITQLIDSKLEKKIQSVPNVAQRMTTPKVLKKALLPKLKTKLKIKPDAMKKLKLMRLQRK